MEGYQQTIISQYANSPTLLQVLANYNTCLDQTANINAFYDYVWNVETAQGYGLDVWGRIVGVSRVLQVSSGTYLGFAEAADSSETPFNQAPFYDGQPSTGNYALTDDAFRTLIYAKALFNIFNGSIPGINAILMLLFGASGDAYVTDGQDMTMTYTFSFVLDPVQQSIVATSGVLPRSSGVSSTIVQA